VSVESSDPATPARVGHHEIMIVDETGHVDVGPMRMFYDRRGDDTAPTLVLLHGGAGDANDPIGGWAALADRFAAHFQIVLVDHRGHGRTANPAGSMTFRQMGDDLDALIEHLGTAPVHLAGISDGGVTALDQVIRRPATVRSAALIGTNYCVDAETLGAVAQIDVDTLERDHPEAAAAFAARHDGGRFPGYWKDLLRQIIANNDVNPTWTPEDLRQIARPVLLVAGEADPFANTRQMTTMKTEIPDAEWLVINDAGHAVHHEHPDIVGARILDFLLRHND
jgi:pimeloyl-ACP methyl ester carboxylesterase